MLKKKTQKNQKNHIQSKEFHASKHAFSKKEKIKVSCNHICIFPKKKLKINIQLKEFHASKHTFFEKNKNQISSIQICVFI